MVDMKNLDLSKGLPKCGVQGCDNNGWIMLAGEFCCGECIIENEKKKNAIILEGLRKDGKKE